MPDIDKLVTDLLEVRKQAQSVVERISVVLRTIQEAPSDGKEPVRSEYIIDYVVDQLKSAGKPMKDGDLITAVKADAERMGVADPEIQTWKSLLFHIGPDKPLAAVIIDGDEMRETVFEKRSAVQKRRREFPGNLIALREWITQE